MSFITGYVIFCLMGWTAGIPTGKALNRVGEVEPGGEGQQIGLRAGDTITAINGQPITDRRPDDRPSSTTASASRSR